MKINIYTEFFDECGPIGAGSLEASQDFVQTSEGIIDASKFILKNLPILQGNKIQVKEMVKDGAYTIESTSIYGNYIVIEKTKSDTDSILITCNSIREMLILNN
jgi:hypothetical protein